MTNILIPFSIAITAAVLTKLNTAVLTVKPIVTTRSNGAPLALMAFFSSDRNAIRLATQGVSGIYC